MAKTKEKIVVIDEDFRKRIAALVKARGMTQKDLATEVGLTESCISHYIKGDRKPKGSKMAALAKALYTTQEFLDGKGGTDREIEKVAKLAAKEAKANGAICAPMTKGDESGKPAKVYTGKRPGRPPKKDKEPALPKGEKVRRNRYKREMNQICALISKNLETMSFEDKERVLKTIYGATN